jgi:Cof subfamily protein (haloacid dehalogenase superfamily)
MPKILNPQRIKALVLDLDGTALLPDAILGERTRNCLVSLISGGMQVILATGRSVEGAQKYFTALGAYGPMVFFNGGEVVDIPSGKLLSADFLSHNVVEFGIELARSMGVHFQVYLPPDTREKNQTRETLVVEKYGTGAEIYHKHTGIVPVVKDLKEAISAPGLQGCIKAMFIVETEKHDEIRAKMLGRFGSRINVVRSHPFFLEILNAGVSKGKGLEIAMKHRGLSAEEVIAFGDEENDLPMFDVAGFSAVPSSAREKIQKAADIVFGPVAEEGLAEFLEKTFAIQGNNL